MIGRVMIGRVMTMVALLLGGVAEGGQERAVEIANAQKVGEWRIDGPLAIDPQNISGVALLPKGLLALGSDEGNAIQILQPLGEGHYRAAPEGLVVLDPKAGEIDIEALAWSDPWLYVLGSHARKRKPLDPRRSAAENRARITEIDREKDRERLFRLRIDPNVGTAVPESLERVSLAKLIKDDPILSPFREIPSKENGVDIEGLAVGPGGELVVGFRGPVLRGNLTPLMVVALSDGRFSQPRLTHELRFVNLEGRGIRSIANYRDRFLLLAGPVGDQPIPYRIYLWDGTDLLPGRDAPGRSGHLEALCELPLPKPGAKAEALELVEERPGALRVLVLFDGLENGAPTVYDCPVLR